MNISQGDRGFGGGVATIYDGAIVPSMQTLLSALCTEENSRGCFTIGMFVK
jgi:hypothetical protein